MKKYEGVSIRSAASCREEARHALRGKWKISLLLFLVLMLMTGGIIGAGCSFSTSTELDPYWLLSASIGPFASHSVWKDWRMISDAVPEVSSSILLPYNPFFVAAAALTALMFLVFLPVSYIAQMRLQISLLDGITPDFSLLHSSGRKYWLFVRTGLLAFWSAFWPMLLAAFLGIILSFAFPDAEALGVLLALAGAVFMFIRLFSYSAAAYLVVSRENITAREAVRTSVQLMKGRKWRYFCLSLSFFGWALVYGAFGATLEGVLGETPLACIAALLTSLAGLPLTLYLYTAQTAFLRDADLRENGWGAQAAQYAESFPAGELPEAGETAEEACEQPAQEPAADDPWEGADQ